MLTRTLVAARTRLIRITTELSNQIRGLMKTFRQLVPAGKGSTFEKNVRSLLADQDELAPVVLAPRPRRQPRYRRDCIGELIQIDSSEHPGSEDRCAPCSSTLMMLLVG